MKMNEGAACEWAVPHFLAIRIELFPGALVSAR
jgi:hypothetical protein